MLLELYERNGTAGILYKIWDKIFHKELFLPKQKRLGLFTTYDGSGQCVHPDGIMFKGTHVFVYTPYPYSVDTYENPSLAIGCHNVGGVYAKAHFRQPVVKEKDYDYHLSDPALYTDEKILYLLYRRTLKSDSKCNELFVTKTKNLSEWSRPVRLLSVDDNDLISPAIVGSDVSILFSVDVSGKKSLLEARRFSLYHNSFYGNVRDVEQIGFDERQIWHIGMSSIYDVNKKDKSPYLALVTLLKDGICSLAYAVIVNKQDKFFIMKLQNIETVDICPIKTVYKSAFCMIQNEIKLFISIRDCKRRWAIKTFTAYGYYDIMQIWKQSGYEQDVFVDTLMEKKLWVHSTKEYVCQ